MNNTFYCINCHSYKPSITECINNYHSFVFIDSRYTYDDNIDHEAIFNSRYISIPKEPVQRFNYAFTKNLSSSSYAQWLRDTISLTDLTCPKHGNKAYGYCFDCGRMFCFESTSHFSHKYILFNDIIYINQAKEMNQQLIDSNAQIYNDMPQLIAEAYAMKDIIDKEQELFKTNIDIRNQAVQLINSYILNTFSVHEPPTIRRFLIAASDRLCSWNKDSFNEYISRVKEEYEHISSVMRHIAIPHTCLSLIYELEQIATYNVKTFKLKLKSKFNCYIFGTLAHKLDNGKYILPRDNELIFNGAIIKLNYTKRQDEYHINSLTFISDVWYIYNTVECPIDGMNCVCDVSINSSLYFISNNAEGDILKRLCPSHKSYTIEQLGIVPFKTKRLLRISSYAGKSPNVLVAQDINDDIWYTLIEPRCIWKLFETTFKMKDLVLFIAPTINTSQEEVIFKNETDIEQILIKGTFISKSYIYRLGRPCIAMKTLVELDEGITEVNDITINKLNRIEILYGNHYKTLPIPITE